MYFKKEKKPLITAIIILTFNFSSCIFNSNDIENKTVSVLDDSLKISKKKFDLHYSEFHRTNHADTTIKTISNIKDSINHLINLTNLMNEKLQKLPEKASSDIRDIFIINHYGDTIYNKFKNIILMAGKCVNTITAKQFILKRDSSVINNNKIYEWNDLIFGSNIPISVILFLKGIQIEIYNIGAMVFAEN